MSNQKFRGSQPVGWVPLGEAVGIEVAIFRYNVYSVMLGGTKKLKGWEPYDTLQFAIVESQHHRQ